MKILIIGSEPNLEETRLKFGSKNVYTRAHNHTEARKFFQVNEVVFDFVVENDPGQMKMYQKTIAPVIFLGMATKSLKRLTKQIQPSSNIFFGFCGIPTFLNREVLEICLQKEAEKGKLSEICNALGTGYQVVADQTGLVTPRVIGMIINEAYCTANEGIATKEDIDLAMTLGTNYPQGPFAWGKMIGIENIYHLLKAVYEDTGDERYRSCEMLDREAGY
ncbi:MAG TPA: 3-hydroxyacyl-CoA dehydrogenase family protein [Cyclobacteriaceae bacterium]|nr:3-hydroxyacyl-CoA dehydrogenase family protein [Cyclobacteriaceae bacterium]